MPVPVFLMMTLLESSFVCFFIAQLGFCPHIKDMKNPGWTMGQVRKFVYLSSHPHTHQGLERAASFPTLYCPSRSEEDIQEKYLLSVPAYHIHTHTHNAGGREERGKKEEMTRKKNRHKQ